MNARCKTIVMRQLHPDWTLQQIADEAGVTRERVRQILARNGLPTRNNKIPQYMQPKPLSAQRERRIQVMLLTKQGFNTVQIAKMLGISQTSVSGFRTRKGIRVKETNPQPLDTECAQCGKPLHRTAQQMIQWRSARKHGRIKADVHFCCGGHAKQWYKQQEVQDEVV